MGQARYIDPNPAGWEIRKFTYENPWTRIEPPEGALPGARKASCLTGSLRRKAWGDKAGRKGLVHLLGVTRVVTPPRCRYLLNARSARFCWRARKDSNLRPPNS